MRSNWRVVGTVFALLAAAVVPAAADDTVVIQFDPQTRAFSSLLPFRTPFTLDVPAPLDTTSVVVRFWAVGEKENCATEHDPIVLSAKGQAVAQGATEKHYQVAIPALHADTNYCVTSLISKSLSADVQTSIATTVVRMADEVAQTGWVYTPTVKAELRANLGSLADARVTSESDSPTLIDLLDKDFSKKGGSPFALEMISAAVSFAAARQSAASYFNALAGFQANPAFAAASKEALTKLKAAKLDTATDPLAPTPVAGDVVAALEAIPKAASATVCRTSSKDCELVQNANWWVAMNASAQNYNTAKDNFASELKKIVAQIVSAPTGSASEQPSYVAAAPLYISGDVGFVMPWFISGGGNSHGVDAQLYVAASVSFAAIDKDIPLASQDGWRRRVSILGGFTLGDVTNSDGTIKGVVGGKGIMGGLGVRITDYVRFSVGGMVVRQADIDRLSSDTHVKVVPYASVSIDLDVASIVTGIFTKGAGLHI